MTIYTAFGVNGNSAGGPGSSLGLGAGWIAGMLFKVTASGYQLSGYGAWCADASQATSAPFALWQATGNGTGTLVASSSATVTGMTPGSWSYVSLGTPIPLTANTVYKAVVGFTSGNGPWQQNMFGAGADVYKAGVVNGPLTIFSANTGTNADSFGDGQGTYLQNQSNPAAAYPTSVFADANPWIDVQITSTLNTLQGAANLAAAPALTAPGTVSRVGAAHLASSPALTAAGVRGAAGRAHLAAVPLLTGTASAIRAAQAALTAAASLQALVPAGPDLGGLWNTYLAAQARAHSAWQVLHMNRQAGGTDGTAGFMYGAAYQAQAAADLAYEVWQAAQQAAWPGARG